MKCCLFIWIFVEDDFTEGEFYEIISDFDPKKDARFVNEGKKYPFLISKTLIFLPVFVAWGADTGISYV